MLMIVMMMMMKPTKIKKESMSGELRVEFNFLYKKVFFLSGWGKAQSEASQLKNDKIRNSQTQGQNSAFLRIVDDRAYLCTISI